MRAVGSWLLALSAAGLLGSVLTAVAPEKNKKTVRFAVGILVILSALRPLNNLSGLSLRSDLMAYEAELSARLDAVRDTAAAGAEAMICANAEQACEQVLAEAGIPAVVTLTPAADGSCFIRAEITYELLPDADTIALAAEAVTAQTGVAAEDQSHR